MSSNIPVSSFGYKVLQKLSGRKGGALFADGRMKVGALIVPPSLVTQFLKHDLIETFARGSVRLTAPGELLLRRLNHIQRKAKNPQSPFPGDPYRAQHSNFKVEVAGRGKKAEKVVRNLGDTPLSWLSRRRDRNGKPLISKAQLEAGKKLSRDFEVAGSLPRTTTFYDGIPITREKGYWRESNPTERQLVAKARAHAALDFAGPGLADILVRVCCFHEGLEQAERTMSWPSRSGKVVLKIGLDRLADFYRIKK